MTNKTKTIVWIEDNPGDDRFDFIFDECEKNAIHIEIISSLDALAHYIKNNPDNVVVSGVLLDLMIFDGNNDLRMFKDDEGETERYKKVTFQNAESIGKLLLKHIISSGNFKIFDNSKICILTSINSLYKESISEFSNNKDFELVTKTSDNDYKTLITRWIHIL